MGIHPTAIVDRTAELGDVDIGPYAVVGPRVTLHDGVVLMSHAVVHRDTVLGARTVLHPHAVLGGDPQDTKHDDGESRLVVGQDNVFREFSTAHRGSSSGHRLTEIGDNNYFMAQSHVAHDCKVGSSCMFANSAAIAGHVDVGDGVVFGGLSAVHQHARVGRLAMVGGGAMAAQDVPPFTLAQGDRARLYGLNVVGLTRGGFPPAVVVQLKSAWRTLFVSGLAMRAAMGRVREEMPGVPEVEEMLAFLSTTVRGICRAAVPGGPE